MKRTLLFDQPNSDWLTIREVAANLPGRPHIATVTRWTQRPVRGRILPSTLIGGKRLIKRSDLVAFLTETAEPSETGEEHGKRQAVASAQVEALLR